MEVFWITAWKPLATAKLAMKSITKPGKKAKFTPVTPQGGGAKELKYAPLSVAELQQMKVPESCGGIVIDAEVLLHPDRLPEYFWVIGPHWPRVLPLPKVREWLWIVSYRSKRFGAILQMYIVGYHGIGNNTELCISYGSPPLKYYNMQTALEVEDTSSGVNADQFEQVVRDWFGEFGLLSHPSVKSSQSKQSSNWPGWEIIFHDNLPRWLEENGDAVVRRVLAEDADPAYPIALISKVSYAAANASLNHSVSNVYDDATAILQYAKDHPLPGKYTVYFFEIGSPTWAQREKRRKKLKDDATELERLGKIKLENGARGEVSLLMGKRGYRFYLSFDEHPDDAIRFPGTELFKAMKWQLG